MRITLALSLLLALLAIIFALLNNQDVSVSFGLAQTTGPLALVLMITFILGVITGILAMLPGRLRKRKEVRTLKKKVTPSDTEQPAPDPSPHTSDSSSAA